MGKNEYAREWRKKNPRAYHVKQLRWYYKNKKRILAGWRKADSAIPDEYDIWAQRFDN